MAVHIRVIDLCLMGTLIGVPVGTAKARHDIQNVNTSNGNAAARSVALNARAPHPFEKWDEPTV